jgi:hypothetical protein
LLDGRTNHLFGDWSIADVDLAMMLQRLIVLGDPVPQRLIDYAAHQWRRPSVEQWINHTRLTGDNWTCRVPARDISTGPFVIINDHLNSNLHDLAPGVVDADG